MPWWGWITVGALLLVAELTLVDLEFFLVLLGVSALAVGVLGLAGADLPIWAQWMTFAVLSVVALVGFRSRLYHRLHPAPEGEIPEGVEGASAVAVGPIAPGATGAVTLRGSSWTGRNLGPSAIPAGARCRVERSDGLLLELRLEDDD